MASVAHPESIVTTDWVAENLGDPNVRLVEVDVDTEAYDQGHIRARSDGTGRPNSTTSLRGTSCPPSRWASSWAVPVSAPTRP